MRHARTKKHEISFFLQRDFSIRKKQDEVTTDEDVQRLDGVARRPLTARLALCMGVPLQLQLGGPKWVVMARHEMPQKPAPCVLRGADRICGNWRGRINT